MDRVSDKKRKNTGFKYLVARLPVVCVYLRNAVKYIKKHILKLKNKNSNGRVLLEYLPWKECSVLGHVCAPCAVCRTLPTRRLSTFSYVPAALCCCRIANSLSTRSNIVTIHRLRQDVLSCQYNNNYNIL